MKLGSIALAAAVALAPAAGMAATAPNRPAAPAVSQFDQGVAAWGRADYATAYRMFRLLADQGDA